MHLKKFIGAIDSMRRRPAGSTNVNSAAARVKMNTWKIIN
jgi:hypothetical protein